MARPRNNKAYGESRIRLLDAGEEVIRSTSFAETGISDVLQVAEVPKGSFYHYFDSKEAFGIAVAHHYHDMQMAGARRCFADTSKTPIQRLRGFFEDARADMAKRGFGDGCLMCNLSTELAAAKPEFQVILDTHWIALVAEMSGAIAEVDMADLNLAHLTPDQAADWLMNAWAGALTRMKASRDDTPLALFMLTIFQDKGT